MGNRAEPLARTLDIAIADRLGRMPVVVVTGARQTGKTTLVRHLEPAKGRHFVTLDSLGALDQARREPDALVSTADRMTIDEVQRAPDLLLAVKRAVDDRRSPGRFLLTGSANLALMSRVSESLAGRASYLVLRPLTEREKRRESTTSIWSEILASPDLTSAIRLLKPPARLKWKRAALEGGLPPAALARSPEDRHVFFESYVDTYVRRDLQDLAQVGDLATFVRLVRLLALRQGGLVNYADLSRDLSMPRTTVQRWTSILETSFLVTLLPAYVESRKARLIKAPKLYFGDTGLGLHMARIDDEAALERDARSGSWLEGLVLNDLLAWRETLVRKPDIFHWRSVND